MATTGDTEGCVFWRRFRLLLLGLVLCRGLVLLCILPPFEGWDEYQHVGYVQHVGETGLPAVLGETSVPPALLPALLEFPQPKNGLNFLGRLGAVDYASYWSGRDQRPAGPPGEVPLYQAVAVHTPKADVY